MERNAFTALNTAFPRRGHRLGAGLCRLEAPIHLLFVSTDAGGLGMAHPRVLVVMGRNSKASIVESYVSLNASRYFTNGVT